MIVHESEFLLGMANAYMLEHNNITKGKKNSTAVLKTQRRRLSTERAKEMRMRCNVGSKTHRIVMSNRMTSLSLGCHIFRLCPRKVLLWFTVLQRGAK